VFVAKVFAHRIIPSTAHLNVAGMVVVTMFRLMHLLALPSEMQHATLALARQVLLNPKIALMEDKSHVTAELIVNGAAGLNAQHRALNAILEKFGVAM